MVSANLTAESGHHFPTLHVKTIPVSLPADFKLINALPADGQAFIRNEEGMIGRGVLISLTATGPGRMESLAHQWKTLCAKAVVTDPTSGTGHGLVAFGALAFADDSTALSTLVIPRQILGLRDGRVLLRASGTEPLVRVMVEAADEGTAQSWANRIAVLVEQRLAL